MSIWDGIENAEIFERGNFLKGGFIGVVEITKTLVKQTRAAGPAFIVEMRVITSNMPGSHDHPVGQKVTWFQKLIDTAVAFPAVAEWAAACAGVDPSDREMVKNEVTPVLKQMMDEACSNPASNDFTGLWVHVETVQVKTKNDRDFTRHTWKPADQPQRSVA